MHRLHLTRNLRSLAFLMIATAVVALLATLAWANHTGLPESWRTAIEREIGKQGAYVKIGHLSYHPLRGVVASKVRVFADPQNLHEVSRLESVILDFDKTQLARGIVHLTKIQLQDAQLTLPLNPNDPAAAPLEVTGAYGTLFMPGERRFEIRNARGRIAGIEVNLDARLIGYQASSDHPSETSPTTQHRELLTRIIGELKQWHFDSKGPPQLRISIEGDANRPAALTAKLAFLAHNLGKNQHLLSEVAAEAEITGDLLTLTALHAVDARGALDGHLDYDLGDREGRFDVHSTLEIPRLLQAWLGLPTLHELEINGRQALDAAGGFRVDANYRPQFQVTGHARCEAVRVKSVLFDVVQSAFAWRDGDFYLRDVRLTRPDGEARGKVMIQGPLVHLLVETTLPIAVYRPFALGVPLEQVLNDFTDRKGAETLVTLEGGFATTDPTSWALTGQARVKNVNYRGVPVNSAECHLALSHRELDFSAGTVVFNYQNYPLREAFNGPKQGTVKVGRIRYDAPNQIVEVEAVDGTIWAAPVVRLFAPKVADSLEAYRFHHPPELQGSGVVDVSPQGRTALDIAFSSAAPADYRFLGETLTLEQPAGKVAIRGERVTVDDLKCTVFDGPITGRFEFQGNGKLNGELSWTRLSIPPLTSTYGFQLKGGGNVTGRLDFSLLNERVETMSGEGLFALEQTELFAVPVFGPLSPLISGVLNDRSAGFERAKSAFCTFKIKDGILSTKDFKTATPSVVFVGDGAVDLKERTLDLTMRMNARGLFSLLTLPLRPFYGMFQFRGTGPLKDPKWENVMFTAPPEGQNELLLPAPKARILTPPQ
ncbi:MAG: AsmA-like C-terminal region-containing protein [Verrucomicrobiota bacterium]